VTLEDGRISIESQFNHQVRFFPPGGGEVEARRMEKRLRPARLVGTTTVILKGHIFESRFRKQHLCIEWK